MSSPSLQQFNCMCNQLKSTNCVKCNDHTSPFFYSCVVCTTMVYPDNQLFDYQKKRQVCIKCYTIVKDDIEKENDNKDTCFQRVSEFNRLFGNKIYTTPRLDIFDSDPKCVERSLSLITEEYRELCDAVKNKDFVETVDALSDILVVISGMACQFGIDLDKSFDIVHKSNMSKLCKTEGEAIQTVKWYLENEKRYDSPYYELAPDNVHYVVRNKSTNKILKSINYIPANFDVMLK